jgi:ABC-type multidrug transport system fused ATPase/permease subunit
MTNISISLKQLWKSLEKSSRRNIILLFILNVINAFAEVISIGSIIPIVSLLMDEKNINKYPVINQILSILPSSIHSKVLGLLMLFAIVTILVGIIRYVTLVFTNNLAFNISSSIAIRVYTTALYKPYPVHLQGNSSETISNLTTKVNSMISGIFLPLLTFVNSFFVILSILGALMIISPLIASVIFVVFGTAYWIISKRSVKKVHENSGKIARLDEKLIKLIQESLGGIREIILDGNQKYYIKIFSDVNKPLRTAQCENVIAGASPRYFIESLGIITICSIAIFSVSNNHSGSDIFPVIAAFAFSAQRILPTAQILYSSWSSLVGNSVQMKILANDLQVVSKQYEDITPLGKMEIMNQLEFKNVSFRYVNDHPDILHQINFVIPRATRVGIVGKTGMGKTTLMDMLMGLLEPTNGSLTVDGNTLNPKNVKQWRNSLAHVPQNIYLSDLSIRENIAFGFESHEVEMEKVYHAAKNAQLHDFIMQLPEQYDTLVGERGVRLSGGQRQRIGIARALYKKANIIILDEATSALDSETEEKIMRTIYESGEQVTMFIIAHRLSTLKLTDLILEVKNKNVIIYKSYDEYIREVSNKAEIV